MKSKQTSVTAFKKFQFKKIYQWTKYMVILKVILSVNILNLMENLIIILK